MLRQSCEKHKNKPIKCYLGFKLTLCYMTNKDHDYDDNSSVL